MFRQTKAMLQKLRYLSFNGQQHTWRLKSTSAERALQYQQGQKIHGFTVKEVVAVPDLFLTAVKLTHDKTGAQYLHAARDDSNNLFSVQFRTTPMDSTGVPHILEHTVLCGSEKYPCRDPFFKMLNRSLSTFMNAFTASDYTMYPFSTQNGKDFQNLLSVYLDAVFFPCLREQDFWQEGWRLENENPKDPNSPLVFKGVVFNEMKGAFSDNERLYAQHLQNKLYPDHTYSVVSGGEPLIIPDLTWEQLRQFHATHYHPSNARFFTYGDLPLEQHLKQIEEEALSKFERIDPNTEVPPQPHWSSPREDHVTCSPDALAPDPTRQNTLCVSYLLGDITDAFEGFTLSLLSSLMISGPNSPFYKALIEPKIGTDFSSVVGYDGSTKEASFSIGLQGMAEEDTERVKQIINQTIDDIIENGFVEERIEALLHKIEIQMKHQSTNFGLSLASYIASSWNHDGDPVQLLQISDSVATFRQALAENPRFLQDKVKHYFKENTHRLTLSMSPDEAYLEKQAKAEEEKLQKKIQALSDSDRKEIYEKGLELLDAQSKTQDASCLPALKVSDIQPTIPLTPVQISTAGGVPVQYCEQPTNGLVYFRAMCSLNTLPEDLRLYVPLFCSVITRMGCGGLDYRQQAQQMDLRTGGMSVSTQVIPDSTQLDVYEQGVLLSSSCLERNLPHMFQLWSDIFNSPHFDDEERLRVLVMMSAQELANGISYSGHMYAMTRAGRHLTPAGDLQESFSGMEQVKFMKRIAEMSDLGPVIRTLPRIKKHLLNPDSMRCAINSTPQKLSDTAAQLESFIKDIAENRRERKPIRANVIERPLDPLDDSGPSRKLISELNFQPCQMKTFFQMPFPVNFVSESLRTVPFSHEDYASLCLLARMMTAKFLHGEIREKGGAYGGGARMGGGGLFSFYSYRDPNSVGTLSAFRKGVDWAKSGQFTQQDIDEAKLSVFSAVDSPVAPADKGMGLFLSGVTDEMKQSHRERLFAVTHKNLVDVAKRYLSIGQRTCGAAILGPENETIEKDPSWIVK
ncbi:presequence protease, mitochondrial [Xiphias gladius]|uniref:presequence protease, mitochondrial n=1 Tax=Xiphias gladius TaxID=8245 RepID=UPI001A98381F|nr:presequence protease, mitochondrial [Xiphias gladius]XP_039999441.1 presequence protease, mitochondrial [Xiphias gladius]XP_039999442.1 presequence protease, mitochondrial [Xiphias gladius]XP_039999443.1 presequence protease, mitochondrial [Xiphias gladius]XP_039999444.1 presequence protease, mitochondrial [Xiphias gladius]XP_039999446.1 presequence protease, mitochondrial [Xiphias gladius]XP_039999447.1 presequence protease, mitochondrial [Xiphias gladius]